MQPDLNRAAVDGQAGGALLDDRWQRIRQHLEAEKEQIYQEISYYPPPIPACDVQFNDLLQRRTTVLQELGQVNAILKMRLTVREQIEFLNEFMQSSQHLTGELVGNIRQSLT